MKYPTNNKEFLELLKFHKVADPGRWVNDQKEFNPRDVVQYLFLQMIWNCLETPKRSCASEKVLEFFRNEKVRLSPSPEKEVSGILEKMVEAGISPEEISKVISFKQQGVVLEILYALEDSSYGQYKDFQDEFHLGTFEFDDAGLPIPNTGLSGADHRFYDAAPKSYEEVIPLTYSGD